MAGGDDAQNQIEYAQHRHDAAADEGRQLPGGFFGRGLRRCVHQYAPGYIKWGCDATVYDGFPDFIFANNTDYPIKIVTYWNNNNVTVEILGTKVDDSYVEMVSETVDVIPWETVYEETDELAPGEKQEIQTPYTGYVVQTWRNVYAGDGSLLSSTFEATSNYESRDQIIRIGKAKP